jgi:hypothetical protein
MGYDAAVDFYQDFDKHPAEFAATATFADYCAAVGDTLHAELLAKYRWAPAVFATAKAGKRTMRALTHPTAAKFSDLFTAAVLAETTGKGRAAVPAGSVYLSGEAGLHGFFGGQRGWKADVRQHMGTKFFGTFVTPRADMFTIHSERISSFEAIPRTDGILIIARDTIGIEGVWVALLDPSEDIEAYFSADTKAFLRVERAAAAAAWGGDASDYRKG